VLRRFLCPRLLAEVELTEERERHIEKRHPELLPAYRDKLAEVLADPDVMQRTDDEHLFSRWYTDIGRGRHIVVVVISQANRPARHWIVTAYMTRRLRRGGIEWRRS
jgi:hypothetical protein